METGGEAADEEGLFDVGRIRESPECFFAPEGMYLWDPWFLKYEGVFHCFFLTLPRARSFTPAERDFSGVSVGHAVSENLVDWEPAEGGLKPGGPGCWDDASIWDGSTVVDGEVFHMFYTAVRQGDLSQRIGRARSSDLNEWVKDGGNPVLQPAHGMEKIICRNRLGEPPCFRDPHVFRDDGGLWHMLLSEKAGLAGVYDGFVAHYVSCDLESWESRDPLIGPGRYDILEESHMVFHGGRFYLFFSTHAVSYSPGWRMRAGGAFEGLHCYYADSLEGPYRPVNGDGLVLSLGGLFYGGKVLRMGDGSFRGIGWLARKPDGTPIARMSPPFNVKIEEDRVWCGGLVD